MKELLVTRKGQVTIPAEYRKKCRINEGSRVLIEDTNDALLLRPIQNLEEQAGIDAGKITMITKSAIPHTHFCVSRQGQLRLYSRVQVVFPCPA